MLPRLQQVWPAATANIARSAGHLAQAAQLLSLMAREDLQRLAASLSESDRPTVWGSASGAAPAQLPIAALLALGELRAANALREWCLWQGAPLPSTARMTELLRQLAVSRADASLLLRLPGWDFRRYRNLLFLLNNFTSLPEAPEDWSRPWPAAGMGAAPWPATTVLPAEHWPELGGWLLPQWSRGEGLSLARLCAARVPQSASCSGAAATSVSVPEGAWLQWRLRRGGERIRLSPSQPTQTLGNLWQARGLPPWQRQRLPLLWWGDTLLAVPGLGYAADWQAHAGEAGLKFDWCFSPPGDRAAPVV